MSRLLYQLSYTAKFGGADGDRTRDLLHAMEALSQLSYSPKFAILKDSSYILDLGSRYVN